MGGASNRSIEETPSSVGGGVATKALNSLRSIVAFIKRPVL